MEKAIKFSIENKQFVRALKTATKVINRKNALPILSSVKRLQEALGVPQSYILLYSIEDCDIPEDKLKTAKHLLTPLKDYLLREDF